MRRFARVAYFSDGKNMFFKNIECYINAKQSWAGLDMFNALLLTFIKPLQHLSFVIFLALYLYIMRKKNLVYKFVFPKIGPKYLFIFPSKKLF